MSLECTDQNTNEEDAETSDLLCKHMHMKNNLIINTSSSSSPLLSLVTSTSEISHQPVHTYTTYINDKGVDRTGRQGIEEKYSIT